MLWFVSSSSSKGDCKFVSAKVDNNQFIICMSRYLYEQYCEVGKINMYTDAHISMVPEMFNSISSSYPTKSSQNRCPSILKSVLDQSFLLRLVLQVKTWFPSCMQHFSVYIPGPSHLCDEEQLPNIHLKSEVDHFFIETSKQMLLESEGNVIRF